jgi:hypothetical protein
MRKIALLILVVAGCDLGFCQTVTFNADTYNSDKPLSIHGTIGQRSAYSYLSFINKSAYKVKIAIHTHSDFDFVHFVDDKGNTGHKITITLKPYGSYKLKSYAYMPSGTPQVYNDELGMDVLYYNTLGQSVKKAYFEVGFTAYLYEGNSTTYFTRPTGYNAIMVGNLPARWNISDLPLSIYSNHSSYGYSNYDAVLQKAINVWNAAGKSIGLNVNFFSLTSNYSTADIKMDWSGKVIRESGMRNALGIAVPGRNIVGMWPLKYYSGLGQAGEVLCQELCHLLGLEHSSYRYDIMNGTARGHWHNLSKIQITERDRQMLGWLYTLDKYYAFRAR